jgi:hypothetical protein
VGWVRVFSFEILLVFVSFFVVVSVVGYILANKRKVFFFQKKTNRRKG